MCSRFGHDKDKFFANPDSPWIRPQASKTETPNTPLNTIPLNGTESAHISVTLKQEEMEFGDIPALLDSRAGANVINMGTAMKFRFKTNYRSPTRDKELTAVNGERVTISGIATATLEFPNNMEHPIIVYKSPDISKDTIIISCDKKTVKNSSSIRVQTDKATKQKGAPELLESTVSQSEH